MEMSAEYEYWRPTELVDLPDLVILNIMKYLPLECIKKVRRTCSRLRDISYSKEMINNQQFVMENDEQITIVLNNFTELNVSHLNLKFFKIKYFHNLEVFRSFILFNGSKINSLTFINCQLTRGMLEDIMFLCRSLKELSIYNPEILWLEKSKFGSNIKNDTLQILEFSRLGYDDESYNLLESCLNFYPRIKSLLVMTIPGFSNSAKQKFVDLIANKISTHNKCIQKLQLIISSPAENICKDLSCLDLKLQNFKELELTWNLNNSFADLTNLLSRCTQLESFSLLTQRGKSIPYLTTLETISKYGKNLKTLKIAGEGSLSYKNEPNRHLRTKDLQFMNLQHVELKIDISQVNYENNITVDLEFLEKCNLKHFKLYAQSDISVEAVMRVISASQNTLVNLDFHKVNRVWRENLTYFESISNLQFPKLEQLNINLSSPRIVANKFVGNFEFPRLKKLDLKCDQYLVGKQEVEDIKIGCPRLETLRIYFDDHKQIRSELISDLKKSIESLKWIKPYNNDYEFRNPFRSRLRP